MTLRAPAGPFDPQSVFDGTTLTVTCRAAFGLMPSRMPRSGGVAVRLRCHRGALACKSWAARVPQCERGVLPRRISGHDAGPSAVIFGSLLHGCYMVKILPTAAGDLVSCDVGSTHYVSFDMFVGPCPTV
jgi:hypothetical protein